jgi:hypothetical protein
MSESLDFKKLNRSKDRICSAKYGIMEKEAYIDIIHPGSKIIMTNKLSKEQKSKLKKGLFNKVRAKVKRPQSGSRRSNFKKFYTQGPMKHQNRSYKPVI